MFRWRPAGDSSHRVETGNTHTQSHSRCNAVHLSAVIPVILLFLVLFIICILSASLYLSHSNTAAPASSDESDQRENDRSSSSPPSSSSAGRSWHLPNPVATEAADMWPLPRPAIQYHTDAIHTCNYGDTMFTSEPPNLLTHINHSRAVSFGLGRHWAVCLSNRAGWRLEKVNRLWVVGPCPSDTGRQCSAVGCKKSEAWLFHHPLTNKIPVKLGIFMSTIMLHI